MPKVFIPILYILDDYHFINLIETGRKTILHLKSIGKWNNDNLEDQNLDLELCKRQLSRTALQSVFEVENYSPDFFSSVKDCQDSMAGQSNYKISHGYVIAELEVPEASCDRNFLKPGSFSENDVLFIHRGLQTPSPMKAVVIPLGAVHLRYIPGSDIPVLHKKSLYIFDFDKTLTKHHTFETHGMYSNGPRAKDPRYSRETSDTDILNDLRNPYAIKVLMEQMVANGDDIVILSNHDNPQWIRRNLEILLGDENQDLLDKIKVIATQAIPEYEGLDPSKHKNAAIRDLPHNPALQNYILIDDNPNEYRNLSENLKQNIEFINASKQIGKESYTYLNKISSRVSNIDQNIFSLNLYKDQRNNRSDNEYMGVFSSFFSKIKRSFSKTEKFAAVDALIDALQKSEPSLDSVHLAPLEQGELKKLVNKLDIKLDELVKPSDRHDSRI